MLKSHFIINLAPFFFFFLFCASFSIFGPSLSFFSLLQSHFLSFFCALHLSFLSVSRSVCSVLVVTGLMINVLKDIALKELMKGLVNVCVCV